MLKHAPMAALIWLHVNNIALVEATHLPPAYPQEAIVQAMTQPWDGIKSVPKDISGLIIKPITFNLAEPNTKDKATDMINNLVRNALKCSEFGEDQIEHDVLAFALQESAIRKNKISKNQGTNKFYEREISKAIKTHAGDRKYTHVITSRVVSGFTAMGIVMIVYALENETLSIVGEPLTSAVKTGHVMATTEDAESGTGNKGAAGARVVFKKNGVVYPIWFVSLHAAAHSRFDCESDLYRINDWISWSCLECGTLKEKVSQKCCTKCKKELVETPKNIIMMGDYNPRWTLNPNDSTMSATCCGQTYTYKKSTQHRGKKAKKRAKKCPECNKKLEYSCNEIRHGTNCFLKCISKLLQYAGPRDVTLDFFIKYAKTLKQEIKDEKPTHKKEELVNMAKPLSIKIVDFLVEKCETAVKETWSKYKWCKELREGLDPLKPFLQKMDFEEEDLFDKPGYHVNPSLEGDVYNGIDMGANKKGNCPSWTDRIVKRMQQMPCEGCFELMCTTDTSECQTCGKTIGHTKKIKYETQIFAYRTDFETGQSDHRPTTATVVVQAPMDKRRFKIKGVWRIAPLPPPKGPGRRLVERLHRLENMLNA